jgi:tetratricopeptide (TPR) repeat protein
MAIHSFIPEREWKIISQRSMQGETEAVLLDYERLYGRMGKNWRFLYNYGAELHHSKRYDKSLSILDECRKRLNDYDVQMLIGDCLQNTGDTIKAIEHYNYAGRMVPSKFLPQYYIMKLYMDKGDTLNAITVANAILAKDVKVERSKAVQRIIREAQEMSRLEN